MVLRCKKATAATRSVLLLIRLLIFSTIGIVAKKEYLTARMNTKLYKYRNVNYIHNSICVLVADQQHVLGLHFEFFLQIPHQQPL
uniref:Putative secreted protein n=1 Tax=Anopheles darlingi TaxID=43151 RepID=A0A2M4D249_ANODA